MLTISPPFMKRWGAPAALLLLLGSTAHATLIDFEDVSGSTNVSPSTPYSAFGFTLTPLNSASGVFQNEMPGDSTFTFDFQGEDGVPGGPFLNPITLTGRGDFDLTSFIAGRTYFAPTKFPMLDLTVTGYFADGTSQMQTFTGLTDATLETLNWTYLTSGVFTGSTDAGIDNLSVAGDPASATPEPGSLALVLMAGAAALVSLRRPRKIRAR